jgi:peptidyl-prolyl cis-trans isomerase C
MVGDKVLLTEPDFEQNVELLMQSQAGIKDIIACMSPEQQDQVYNNILEGLVNERIITQWISDQGLDKTPEYKEQARRAHEAVDRDLAIHAFEREVVKQIVFNDDEAQNWYDKNRERLMNQPFLEAVGGVKAKGFAVNSEKEAKDMVAKLKAGSSLDKVAQESKKTVMDFGLVSPQSSSVDPQVRTKILSMKTLPLVEMVKGADNKYWVIQAMDRVEPTFCAFGKVKDIIKERMKEERAMDYLRKKVDEIRELSKVVINKDYLKRRAQQGMKKIEEKATQTMESMHDSMAAAMPQKSSATPKAA